MLLELTLRQSLMQQQVINRFHYNSGGTPASVTLSFALVHAFGAIPVGDPAALPTDSVLQAIRLAQGTILTHTEIEAKALYDVEDFYTRPFSPPLAGLRSSETTMSPANALGFRSSRVRQDIRRGFKRFAGITEEMVQAGGDLASGGETAATLIATRMADILEYDDEGNTLTFTPVILKFQEYTTPSGRKAYKKYATLAAQEAQMASGILWEYYDSQRTQVSRQIGRGS